MHSNSSLARIRLSCRLLAASIPLWTLTCVPALAQPQLVACDLVDRQLVSVALQSTVRGHFPNREIRSRRGAAESLCLFWAERSRFIVYLAEYPSPAAAAHAFREDVSTSAGASPMYVTEKGLGDEAYWWSFETEAHGFFVRKGRRVLTLRTSWADSITGPEAKVRLRPIMPAIVSKL